MILFVYCIIQLIAFFYIGCHSDQILDSFDDGVSLLHLILAILFFPIFIVDISIIFIGMGLEVFNGWLIKQMSKLQKIKIYKSKQ